MVDSKSIVKIMFNLLNITVGILFCVCGVLIFIPFNDFSSVIVGLYLTLFGAFIAVLEIIAIQKALQFIPFYFYFAGRALWFIFLSCLCLGPNGYRLAVGVIGLAVSVFYLIFQCFPVIQFPEPIIGTYRGGAATQPKPAARV